MSHQLSAAIITFNEAHRLHRALDSLIGVADEVVIIDSHSTDGTIDLIEKYKSKLNIKVQQRPFPGHIEQKNFAIDQCSNDYILSLDGDEALNEDMKKEVIRFKESNNSAHGVFFRRLTNYNGFWVRHCGWYPDWKLRLFHKDHARWTGKNPHDIIKMNQGSKIEKYNGEILHYSYLSVSDHVIQTNKFTTIAAKAAFEDGKRCSAFAPFIRGIFKFLRDYFIKLGFLDGRNGLTICTINALYVFLKYTKIHELQKGKNID
jgi:glycosyltransferase involved in cell wall biosynthesis